MADVELIIKIPEDEYQHTIQHHKSFPRDISRWEQRIVDGIVLPKCYGRLMILSEDAVKREQTPLSFSCQNWISEVGLSNATVAIIEADKGKSED